MSSQRIILGYPLDLIFDRTCKFSVYEGLINDYTIVPPKKSLEKKRNESKNESSNIGGIMLPNAEDPGTGNIIIRGKPGTAKSTFALQIACTAVQKGNDIVSFYITLEESPENVANKCKKFGWGSYVKVLDQISSGFEIGKDYDTNKDNLYKLFFQNTKKRRSNIQTYSNKVIISTLNPRNIFKTDGDVDILFHSRYEQLENLLISSSLYNEQFSPGNKNRISNMPKIGMIFIDSLNVFGEKLLSRDQLFRIFDMFKKYGILGVFIVEEDEKSIYAQENTLHSETLEYISDLVVSLTTGEDEGYSFRYFEISKSRYQHQVYGKHPFKIYEPQSKKGEASIAIKVYPSLHYIVYGTDISEPGKPATGTDIVEPVKPATKKTSTQHKNAFCENNANFYLSKEHKKNSSILIEGPRDTFKASLARDFLMKGLFEDGDVNVLFIRFLDYYSEEPNLKSFRISKDCKEKFYYNAEKKEVSKEIINFKEFLENKEGVINEFWNSTIDDQTYWNGFSSQPILKSTKRFFCSFICEKKPENIRKNYTELIYQSGYLLPEEFMQILLEAIIKSKKPVRIVLDEIGRIGSSYPLLYKSKLAGEIFLSAVFHIIRNYNIKLLITGTTGEYIKSDEIINKAKTLVDDVLTTKKINVFGDNFVTLQGGTLTSSEIPDNVDHSNENVPGVIIPSGKYGFRVDKDVFNGLVGFDTDIIYRPGINLYFNKENDTHGYYNEEIRKLLKYAFAESVDIVGQIEDKNTMVTESTREGTATILDSLGLLEGKPIKNTVIVALDEFFTLKEKASFVKVNNEEPKYTKKYYNNLLLFGVNNFYDNEIENVKTNLWRDNKSWDLSSWVGINNIINEAKRIDKREFKLIDFCPEITETQICILLDTIRSAYPQKSYNEIIRILALASDRKDTIIENGLIENLIALKNIIKYSPKTIQWTSIFGFDKLERDILFKQTQDIQDIELGKKPEIYYKSIMHNGLIPDSLFYICWYSELRFLIERNPHLASKIEVHELPGEGFTGDWTLGILKGSVSETLGKVVLGMLCDEKEDFKRFIKGIGLPTSEKFFNITSPFLAWPGSDINIKLSNLFNYYGHAQKRSKIEGYLNLRLAFSSLFKELIMLKSDGDVKSVIVNRLPMILMALLSDEEKKNLGLLI